MQFKRAHRNFILAPSAPRDIIPGDFVKVEADRGEDMGIVLAKCPVDSFEEVIPTAGYRGRGFSSGQGERKYLYRLATAEERNSLTMKVADEEHTLEVRDYSYHFSYIFTHCFHHARLSDRKSWNDDYPCVSLMLSINLTDTS